MKIPIGVSARHVHITEKHFRILFGEEETLTIYKQLSQPTEFASDQLVTIKTEKNKIEKVRILGPFRNYTQVEISKTDARLLGLNPPVRESGDLEKSEGITIVGPKGEVKLNEGCIIASRHIHMRSSDIEKFGLVDVKKVAVLIGKEKRSVLHDVFLKISDSYALDFHIDTDDANACLVNTGDEAVILKEDYEQI